MEAASQQIDTQAYSKHLGTLAGMRLENRTRVSGLDYAAPKAHKELRWYLFRPTAGSKLQRCRRPMPGKTVCWNEAQGGRRRGRAAKQEPRRRIRRIAQQLRSQAAVAFSLRRNQKSKSTVRQRRASTGTGSAHTAGRHTSVACCSFGTGNRGSKRWEYSRPTRPGSGKRRLPDAQ